MGLAIGRVFYLNSVSSPQLPRDTAAILFDTLVRFLREGLRLIAAVGLIVAIAGWLAAGHPGRVRNTAKSLTGKAGEERAEHGWSFGPVGAFVAAHRAATRLAGVGVALVGLLLWTRPTAGVVIALAIRSSCTWRSSRSSRRGGRHRPVHNGTTRLADPWDRHPHRVTPITSFSRDDVALTQKGFSNGDPDGMEVR